jgi:hypothetical protein
VIQVHHIVDCLFVSSKRVSSSNRGDPSSSATNEQFKDIADTTASTSDPQSHQSQRPGDITQTPEHGIPVRERLEAAGERASQQLLASERFRKLCDAAVIRINLRQFESYLMSLCSEMWKELRSNSTISAAEREIAWLIQDRRRLVAFLVCESIAPFSSEKSLATTKLEAVDSKTKEVLERFLRDPVTAIGHGLHVEIPGDMYDPGTSVPDDDEVRTPASDEKHAAALDLARSNFDAALEFLTKKLSAFVFPKPRDRISSVLLNSALGGESLHHVSCHISWQVLEYLERECPQGTDIEDIFTITGELDRAYAARLGDYLREMWATGASFSKALQLALAGVTEDQGGK